MEKISIGRTLKICRKAFQFSNERLCLCYRNAAVLCRSSSFWVSCLFHAVPPHGVGCAPRSRWWGPLGALLGDDLRRWPRSRLLHSAPLASRSGVLPRLAPQLQLRLVSANAVFSHAFYGWWDAHAIQLPISREHKRRLHGDSGHF